MADAQKSFGLGGLGRLGPGLVTGAADDDPSGIATYSQAGAQFGFNTLWTVLLTYPLMVGIQTVSARIGRVTGHGLATNVRRVFPGWLSCSIVSLLLIANTVNIAADIAAMGEALQLLVGGGEHGHALVVGLSCVLLQVFMPYRRYAGVLKLLTLSLLAYVAVAFTVRVPWGEVVARTLLPHLTLQSDFVTMIVAVFGTTISPYLMFWQASQETEELRAHPDSVPLLRGSVDEARLDLNRIDLDTWFGMAFSNLVAFFIILSTGATLNVSGITQITSSAQAAEVLRPLAGDLTFLLFSLGIIGTGMLAVPVLAGSAAYAVAETFGWPEGLDKKYPDARHFYAIIAVATLAGALLDFTPIDPMRALFWTAVINGVIAIPVMAAMMIVAARPQIMGPFVIKRLLRVLGWSTIAIMMAAVVAMLVC